MAVRTIPFDAGQEQGVDRALLSGRFSLVRNGVLSRDGQLRPRPAFTALAATAYGSGTFVAYDLFSYNDRLVALGDVMGLGYPTDVAELIEGGAAAWRPTVPSPTVPRLPRATQVRDFPQPPDQRTGVVSWGCAAFGGFTCLAWNNGESSSEGFIMAQRASTGQVIALERKPPQSIDANQNLRPIELGDRFIVVGFNSTRAVLSAWRLIPTSDEAFVDLGTLTNDAVIYTAVAAARAEGSTNFVTVTASGVTGVLRTRLWTNAGVNIVPSGGQFANITDGVGSVDRLEVHASATDNRITIACQTDGTLNMYTFNLTTGAAVGTGPFVPFSGQTITEFGMCSLSANLIYIVGSIPSLSPPQTRVRTYNTNTNAFGTSKTLSNLRLASSPIVDGAEVIFAARCGPDLDSQSNTLVAVDPTVTKSTTPLINKDFEISTANSLHLPNLVKDASTGLWYWANAALSADLQAGPRLTEFAMNSTERRQICQVGALLLIGGGVPVTYDGVQLAECCFLNRPRIVSVTTAGSGSLLNGSTYIYKSIWEALDSDDNVIRSAISSNVEHTTSGTATTVVQETPLSMRLNAGALPTGSAVRVKLYRTVATADESPPVITGVSSIDPPSGSLTGLTLIINFNDGVGTLYTVTFSAGATTVAAILAEINAVTGADVEATAPGGILVLTGGQDGDGILMQVPSSGTALAILGLAAQAVRGTTERTTGDVFHLCATKYTSAGAEIGSLVSVDDTMSDDDLREQQVIYTQVENPLDHHPPGPADYVASGGDIVTVTGQPRRDRWTASKPLAVAQGIQFANPGREKFSRRIRGDIEGIVQRDEETVLYTRREIWAINGTGPDRAGKGDFARTRLVYGEGGLRALGWRSILNIKDETFFQLDDDKLYSLKMGGTPEWIGHPVIDTLAANPVITAVCHVKESQTVAFACQTTNGASGVLLRYDLRRKQWFEDDIGPIDALAEYRGRLAVVIAGVVYLQDEAFGSGTMPTLTARLGSFTNFGSLGWGALTAFTLLGQYRGPCTIEIQVSYDDLVTWVTCGTFTLTAANYTAGQPIELEFYPATQECSRFALQAIVTGTESNSGGAWLNAIEIHDDKDEGPARKGSSFTR